MSLLTDAKKIIRPDFVIGERDDVILTDKCRNRMNNIIKKFEYMEDFRNFNLPYVKNEIDEWIESKPDPNFEIPSNLIIELFEKLIYSKNKSITVDDKIIIAYLAIYCSI